MSEKITIAVLDYNKKEEALHALKSIQKYAVFNKHVVYLDNGSDLDLYNDNPYSLSFLKDGLIDELIINKKNTGCGSGMEQLYRAAPTKYVLLHQVDQELMGFLRQNEIDEMIKLLENGYSCIDLNGNQGHGKFSDRAHLMSKDLYLSIPKSIDGNYGGPGPFNHLKYTEEFVGDYFIENNLKIYHAGYIFADKGKWSIRQLQDGTRTKHLTDTKQLWFLDRPTQKNPVFPNLTDEEWNLALTSGWPDGKIPEKELSHSFHHWS